MDFEELEKVREERDELRAQLSESEERFSGVVRDMDSAIDDFGRVTTENERLREERDELLALLAACPTGPKVPFDPAKHKDSMSRLCWFAPGARYGIFGRLCVAWWCGTDKGWRQKGWRLAGWTEPNNPTHVAELREVEETDD